MRIMEIKAHFSTFIYQNMHELNYNFTYYYTNLVTYIPHALLYYLWKMLPTDGWELAPGDYTTLIS